ncbi:carbohydrate kinase family protein [Candidatus Izemoplasma sp. B36]|uniref:carbohydrate kinase family protein n=1 Tax=Candidatus Izemoplasma sp. B36 TaxID=3242468 RepID=UPI003556154A
MKTLVIGACNIDMIGTSNNELIDFESNIGHVTISLGGVAKNIATNLFYLGLDLSFLTLIGNDSLSLLQKTELDKIGIDYSNSFIKNLKSSSYMAIHNDDGDLSVGINDMKSFESLRIDDFIEKENYINNFDCLVFDTNLNEEVLSYLIEKYKDKLIFVDGVSQTKVKRIKNSLKYIDLLKVNHYELNTLLKTENYDIIKGVKELLKKEIKCVVVSQSTQPITYNIKDLVYQSIIQKKSNVLSSMGAGDALFAGIIYSTIKGNNMHEAVNFGKIVALKTLEVYEANNKEIVKLINSQED